VQKREVTGLGQYAKKMTFAIGLKDNESVVKCICVMHIAPSRLFWRERGRRPWELRG